MSDRTSAEMCGRVLNRLDAEGAHPETIRAVWRIMSEADFMPYQTGAEHILKRYGICVECGDVGEHDCPYEEGDNE